MRDGASAARHLPLAGVLALHVVLVLAVGPGFMASDDLSYGRAAHKLSTGTFDLAAEAQHWSQRLGLVAPTALVFRLFGTGSWQAVVVPTVASLSGIATAYWFLRSRAPRGDAWRAALLYCVLPTTLSASTLLLPDNAIGVAILAAACLTIAGRSAGARRPALFGIGAAAVIAFSVTVKLTTVWAAPVFVALLVRDLLRRRHGRFWAAFTACGAALGAAYLAMYHVQTGDALFRINVIETGHNAGRKWALAGAETEVFVRRLSVEPFVMMFRALTFTGLLALALPTMTAALAAPRKTARRNVVFSAIAVCLIVLFFFGSTSLRRFAPMPLLPRMLAPIIPLLVVLAAARWPRPSRAVTAGRTIGVLLLAGAAVYALANGKFLQAAVPAALLALLLAPRESAIGLRRRVLLIAILTGATLYAGAKGGVGETATQRVERGLPAVLAEKLPPGSRLLCSTRGERAMNYRSGWDLPADLEFVTWESAAPPFDGVTHVLFLPMRPSKPRPEVRALLDAGEVVLEEAGVRLVRVVR